MSKSASLRVVGLGFQLGHISLETEAQIESSDALLYLSSDPLTEFWLKERKDGAVNLNEFYGEGKSRRKSYDEMVDAILSPVREGKRTCAAFYGHPGVFVSPGHEVIAAARKEGLNAQMLPAISAEDCLFVDLAVDPVIGKQAYEATDFLLRKYALNPAIPLVLWQAGALGMGTWTKDYKTELTLPTLQRFLLETYPPKHPVAIYEASFSAICLPRIEWIELSALSRSTVSPTTTLYFPPASEKKAVDAQLLSQLREQLKLGADQT